MPLTRGIITIAIGRKYADQAKYLAYSCMLHAPHIIRAVITDQPERLVPYYDILIPYNPEYGDPFATKTRLYIYSPFEKTLFLDADSLLIYNVDSYWESLEKRSFAYAGEMITSGEWYLDIEALIKQTGVSWIPKFNSGMFLFDKSDKAKSIFDTAFHYMREGGLEVSFFRAKMLPDEPFLAIALARYGIKPFDDYGRFSRTLIGAKNIHVNVIKGVARFVKQGKQVFPLIVHFCGTLGGWLYLREKIKLTLYFSSLPNFLLTRLLLVLRKIAKGV